MIKKVTGKDLKIINNPRREGDPVAIYADNSKIKKILNWEQRYSSLDNIIKTAWQWHKSHSVGYQTK